mgnify:CR=1 FL=1
MKCKYITIEREYGSGGTKIARLLSDKTGVPCFGQEILEEVSKENDISVETIEKYEEKATGSFLYSIYAMTQAVSGNSDMLTAEGHIYVAEQSVIKRLAAKGSAIFLGHCASEALKDEKGVVRIFIRCTNEEEKRKRIAADYGIAENQIDLTRRHFDKKRMNYYYANTARKWDDLKNYDIVLDSAVLGIDGCVNMLKSLLVQEENKDK